MWLLIRSLTLALLAVHVQGKFGPEWILGPTTSTILYAETTLFLPDTPMPQRDTLLIWAGMPTDQKERYQGVLASYGSKKGMCGARNGQWCAYGRIYTANGNAAAVDPIEAQNGIRIQFTYNPQSGRMIQTISTQGRIIATYEKAAGRPNKFQTAIECQESCTGIVNAHAWRNTTIRLSAPDPNWGSTVKTSLTWTPEPLSSFDRGQTWTIPIINIQQVTF